MQFAYSIIAKDASGNLVHSFREPLTITLVVPEQLVGSPDVGVYWFDTIHKEWVSVPGVVIHGHTVTFKVDHLTEFAILGTSTPTTSIEATSVHTQPHSRFPRFGWIVILGLILIILFVKRQKHHTKK